VISYNGKYVPLPSELHKQLILIDTATKLPNAPRFRLKRATVSALVQKHFGAQFKELDETYSRKELDAELHMLTAKYKGKTIREMIELLDIPFDFSTEKDASKGISEQIIIRMFGGTAKKISKNDLIGLIPKTVVLTKEGHANRRQKLFTIYFDDWTSDIFENEMTFEIHLCIIISLSINSYVFCSKNLLKKRNC